MSHAGCLIVVSGGFINFEVRISSNPTTFISSGTFKFLSLRTCIAPIPLDYLHSILH